MRDHAVGEWRSFGVDVVVFFKCRADAGIVSRLSSVSGSVHYVIIVPAVIAEFSRPAPQSELHSVAVERIGKDAEPVVNKFR